jgi:hypothetical protein
MVCTFVCIRKSRNNRVEIVETINILDVGREEDILGISFRLLGIGGAL